MIAMPFIMMHQNAMRHAPQVYSKQHQAHQMRYKFMWIQFLAAALAEAALEIAFQWWWWWGYFQLKALEKCLFH